MIGYFSDNSVDSIINNWGQSLRVLNMRSTDKQKDKLCCAFPHLEEINIGKQRYEGSRYYEKKYEDSEDETKEDTRVKGMKWLNSLLKNSPQLTTLHVGNLYPSQIKLLLEMNKLTFVAVDTFWKRSTAEKTLINTLKNKLDGAVVLRHRRIEGLEDEEGSGVEDEDPASEEEQQETIREEEENQVEEESEEEEEEEDDDKENKQSLINQFSQLQVVDLRAELKKAGLPVGGLKADLVERLAVSKFHSNY
eukprot:TRINITY_DN6788_c0_g1_i4.p1 TRINITY_DN6788_c0_g1~~TRINITY_DN6788_c0_g1_i4.p1  ORF type:complete len:250 (-),score=102.07 TRINITY_DN6788_c0_g1_i4:98-847(-)